MSSFSLSPYMRCICTYDVYMWLTRCGKHREWAAPDSLNERTCTQLHGMRLAYDPLSSLFRVQFFGRGISPQCCILLRAPVIWSFNKAVYKGLAILTQYNRTWGTILVSTHFRTPTEMAEALSGLHSSSTSLSSLSTWFFFFPFIGIDSPINILNTHHALQEDPVGDRRE